MYEVRENSEKLIAFYWFVTEVDCKRRQSRIAANVKWYSMEPLYFNADSLNYLSDLRINLSC